MFELHYHGYLPAAKLQQSLYHRHDTKTMGWATPQPVVRLVAQQTELELLGPF